MKVLGNLLWWLFGGLEAAIGYFTGSLAMAITIIGIPVALQTAFQDGRPVACAIRKGRRTTCLK